MISVIVVDDDEDLLDCLCDTLTYLNVNVMSSCNNGMDAVQLYKKYKPDFIIIDHNMPNYDGIYALKHIKEFDPSSRVIMISGNFIDDFKNEANMYDVDLILKKPFEIKKLVKQMNLDIEEKNSHDRKLLKS